MNKNKMRVKEMRRNFTVAPEGMTADQYSKAIEERDANANLEQNWSKPQIDKQSPHSLLKMSKRLMELRNENQS